MRYIFADVNYQNSWLAPKEVHFAKMSVGPLENSSKLALSASSVSLTASQTTRLSTNAVVSIPHNHLVTTSKTANSSFNSCAAALTPTYETAFAVQGNDINDQEIKYTSQNTPLNLPRVGMSTILGEGQRESTQRSAILTTSHKPLNGTMLLTTFPATSTAAGELTNSSGLLESHLLQMTPLPPISTIPTTTTVTPIEMMNWSHQHTSKTVCH